MKKLIDIPWQIEQALNNETQWSALLVAELRDIINNGTPLPKGHGRLIDADHFLKTNWEHPDYALSDAPTIIEADEVEA